MPVPHTDDDRRAITQIRKQIGSFRTMVQDIPEALREHVLNRSHAFAATKHKPYELAVTVIAQRQAAGISSKLCCKSSSKLRSCTVSNMVARMSGTWR